MNDIEIKNPINPKDHLQDLHKDKPITLSTNWLTGLAPISPDTQAVVV
ncbi:hypothetical protein RM190_21150 [Paracoccus sp. CPCC 101403]|uniref:Uncharacterized protein n=1 Tax=Paracoccus broussonetiae TaxID=3075834 RepID=A0ABU3EJF4_9RHOB|nr:hypothetical protein [Paracoccus sp. CPCC 101403]MDT1064382.1 hypothetical protein [Paracoccus sp. CPCC 101403]